MWRVVVCRGNSDALTLKGEIGFIEVVFDRERASVVSGRPEEVQEILIEGERA